MADLICAVQAPGLSVISTAASLLPLGSVQAPVWMILINMFPLMFCHHPLRETYPREVRFCLKFVHALTRPYFSPILILIGLMGYGLAIDPSTGSRGIPCLWKLIVHHECLGCGLSRAGAYLVRGDIEKAIATNWLIFPVALFIIFELIMKLVYKGKLIVR